MTKNDAIKIFGSVRKLAEALGITEQAVHQWDDNNVPELRVYKIKDILGKEGIKNVR